MKTFLLYTILFVFLISFLSFLVRPLLATPDWCRGLFLGLITLNDTQPAGLLWKRDRPVVETSTWQHTTFTRDRHPCLWRDSNPQSQQASAHRPTSGNLNRSLYHSPNIINVSERAKRRKRRSKRGRGRRTVGWCSERHRIGQNIYCALCSQVANITGITKKNL